LPGVIVQRLRLLRDKLGSVSTARSRLLRMGHIRRILSGTSSGKSHVYRSCFRARPSTLAWAATWKLNRQSAPGRAWRWDVW
jgi:hypothetical protein